MQRVDCFQRSLLEEAQQARQETRARPQLAEVGAERAERTLRQRAAQRGFRDAATPPQLAPVTRSLQLERRPYNAENSINQHLAIARAG